MNSRSHPSLSTPRRLGYVERSHSWSSASASKADEAQTSVGSNPTLSAIPLGSLFPSDFVMSDILNRIEQQAGVDNLVDILADGLDTSDLNSLLMEVLRRRALKLSDGGLVDWGEKLLSNAKDRLFISGIGSDRACGLKG